MKSEFRLRVFLAVAKNLSFTKASQELYITQPAITKHIKELEEQYKCQLFERMGNRIYLTDKGKLLQQHAQCVVDTFVQLDNAMQLSRGEMRGILSIGASTTITQYVLPHYISAFTTRYPKVQLSLLNGNTRTIEEALLNRKIDIGLIEGPSRLPTLHYTSWMKDELVVVTGNQSKWAHLEEIVPADLMNIPIICREWGSGTLDVLEKALMKQQMKWQDLPIMMHIGSTESIKRILVEKDAIAVVSIQAVRDELMSQKLSVIEVADMPLEREFCFVQQQGQQDDLAAQWMSFLSL